jgi:hypothetical protein
MLRQLSLERLGAIPVTTQTSRGPAEWAATEAAVPNAADLSSDRIFGTKLDIALDAGCYRSSGALLCDV